MRRFVDGRKGGNCGRFARRAAAAAAAAAAAVVASGGFGDGLLGVVQDGHSARENDACFGCAVPATMSTKRR